ncbi:MAG: tetratricopeptide repeat protein [bacterium]
MNLRIFTLILLLAVLSSCAYFNTFYNARKYYEDGVRPLENGGIVNKSLLDRSIEKSSKILQFHSKSEYVDDALLLIGKSYMYTGEYTKAIRKFTELLDYFPNSKFSDETLFFMGKTYLLQGESEVAKTIFKQVVARNRKYRIEAVSECIEIMLEKSSHEEADSFINQLSDRDKKNNKVKFLSGKVKWTSGLYDEALRYLLNVNSGKLSKDDGFDYYRIITDLYLKKNEIIKAEKSINNGIRIFQDHAYKNSLYLMKAKILTANKEYEKAEELLSEVLIQPGATAKDSLIFFKGILYETYFSDYEKALESYRQIVNEEKNSKLFAEAEMKVKSLELFISLSNDSLGENVEQNIENRFLLAEINYLNLDRIDESIIKYKSIADSFPQSVYAPKSLFALSYIYLKDKNDSFLSAEYLSRITDKYPNTEYSVLAEEKLKEFKLALDTLR